MQTSQQEFIGLIWLGIISTGYTLTEDFKKLFWMSYFDFCTKAGILHNPNIFQTE